MATSRSFAEGAPAPAPRRRSVPVVTSSRTATIRSAVVLPQPDGPTRTTNSPSSTKRSSECTASTPFAKTLVTCSSDRVAIGASLLARRGDPDAPPAPVPVRPREVGAGEQLRRSCRRRRRQLSDVPILALTPAVEVADVAWQHDAGKCPQRLDRSAVDGVGRRVDADVRQIGAGREIMLLD